MGLTKNNDGCSEIRRASDYVFVRELAEEGVAVGDMWYSKYFESMAETIQRSERRNVNGLIK